MNDHLRPCLDRPPARSLVDARVSAAPRPRRCRIVRAEDKRPVRQSRLGCHVRLHGHYQLEIAVDGESDEPRSVSFVAGPLRRANEQEQRLTQDGCTVTRYDLQFARHDDAARLPACWWSRLEPLVARLEYGDGRDDYEHTLWVVVTPRRHVGAAGPDQFRHPVRAGPLAFSANAGGRQLVRRLVPGPAGTGAARCLAGRDAGDRCGLAGRPSQRPRPPLDAVRSPPPRDPPRSATVHQERATKSVIPVQVRCAFEIATRKPLSGDVRGPHAASRDLLPGGELDCHGKDVRAGAPLPNAAAKPSGQAGTGTPSGGKIPRVAGKRSHPRVWTT